MSRVFAMRDQLEFARLSGDYNKLHVDDVTARRLIFGRPAVHGMHLVFLAIEEWSKSHCKPFALISLKANFRKPLLVGDRVQIHIEEKGPMTVVLKLTGQGEEILTDIKIMIAEHAVDSRVLPALSYGPRTSNVLTVDEIETSSGELELALDRELLRACFPFLDDLMPALQVAQLLAFTRLIGMECPGENSLFSDVDIEFTGNVSSQKLIYTVREYDPRFSKALIDVHGPSAKGVLGAFVRPSPKEQPSFAEIRPLVEPGEFSGQSAMIIGGSRGLGEVAAKILAAGGAKVLITYIKGSDDAKRVKDELASAEHPIETMFFDVTQPSGADLEPVSKFSPTHVYYFATGFIKPGSKVFSDELFRSFCEYYVSGLGATLDAVKEASGRLKHVFYPSSVFVTERPGNFFEYAAAKAVGEEQCLMYQKKNKAIQMYMPRLPKMSTDQTQNLYAYAQEQDPVSVMLEHLRVFKLGLSNATN